MRYLASQERVWIVEVVTAQQKQDRLGQLRLLAVLDALLREGSVAGAAASLGLQSPAVSRMLSQLRALYDDPLFIRTGKGLLPTPVAERLRARVRAIAAEMDDLIHRRTQSAPIGAVSDDWKNPPLVATLPLSVQRDELLQGEPSPLDIARKLAKIGHNADGGKRLAKYIATTAAGTGRSRPLTMDEATDALGIILSGDADPIQLGALLSVIQYRGVTAAEVAGFVKAAQRHIQADAAIGRHADLDWPVYVSPKVRTPPWFLHAARLVAAGGYRVLLHGHHGQGEEAGKFELAAGLAGIPVCASLAQAREAIRDHSIAYLPIGTVAPQIQSLLGLYPLLEMRLPINTLVHLINPLAARVTLTGVAQPSQRELHRDAARLLDAQDIAMLGNTRDVAEFTPFRATTISRLVAGEAIDTVVPSQPPPATQSLPKGYSSRQYWQAIWSGAARDPSVEAIILSTAAAALLALETSGALTFAMAYARAETLWATRFEPAGTAPRRQGAMS